MLTTVYPRWRGEHPGLPSAWCTRHGLSPLARGTQRPRQELKALWRFIPAGAGNTGSGDDRHSGQPVYPRWRGEHSYCPIFVVWLHGLSPLARGTRTAHASGSAERRFIPAGAGNTYFESQRPLNSTVYPRWRGEHGSTRQSPAGKCGLSPLARGTQESP